MIEFDSSKRLKKYGLKYLAEQNRRIAEIKKNSQIDVINLGRGNPDQPTFQPIVEALIETARHESNHGYPPYGGKASFKLSIKKFYKHMYGVDLNADTEIAIFNGSAVALTALPLALIDEGDTAFVPDPGFSGYEIGVKIAGGAPVYLPLLEQNGFIPDYSSIDSEVARQAKLMFLNYPNNPTGAAATPEFFADTVEFARRNQIAVIHDFAYGSIGFHSKPVSFMQTPGAKDVGVEIYTLSKAFNMAGWRVAFAVGNSSLIAHLNKYLQDSVGSVFGAIQDAAIVALDTQAERSHMLSALYAERYAFMKENLEAVGLEVYPSEGAFFVWVKVPPAFTSKEMAHQLLNQYYVGVVPGTVYGQHGEGYIRISLVTSMEELSKAVSRFKDFMVSLK